MAPADSDDPPIDPAERDLLAAISRGGALGTSSRSLDVIHISAAMTLGHACRSFATFDKRQAEGARQAGLPVAALN